MSHVAVIGAGPAGSTAANLLARAGIEVTLVEQHRFPRDKVCGECLSALGLEVLSRLRLSGEFNELRPVPLHRNVLFATDGTTIEIPLPRPMAGISRVKFDQFLLRAAREAGARILQPARCESHETSLKVRVLETNQVIDIAADYTLIADGKASSLSGDFGLKAHFEGIDAPADAIELFGVEGHYGGVAPIEGGRWNIAFSVPEARLRASEGDLDSLFAGIMGENRALHRQMQSARRVSDWLVSPLPRFAVQKRWIPGVIPIGNSAAALEPIGGEGMGLAMRSAEIAAGHLVETLQGRAALDVGWLRREFRKLWRIRRAACRALGLAVSSPRLARWIVPMIEPDTPLTGLALRAMGKT